MERRREARIAVTKDVPGRVPATPIKVKVLDLSTTGCLVETTNAQVERGSTILLCLTSRLEVAGQIMWREGGRFGVQFHEEIDPDQLARAIDPDETERDELFKDTFGRSLPPLNARMRI